MLDSIIEAVHAELSARFPSTQSRRQRDIEISQLPDTVSSFLVNDLEHAVRRDAETIDPAALPWVDPNDPEITECLSSLKDAIVRNAQIPANEWDGFLRRAIRATVRSYVDPRHALRDFVFGQRDSALPLDTVLGRVRDYAVQTELCRTVEESLAKRDVEELSPERFLSIVEKVDDLRTDGFAASRWLDDLQPLETLLVQLGLQTALPVQDVAKFLNDRGLVSEARRLSMVGRERITLDDMKSVLDSEPEPAEADSTEDWTLFNAPQPGGPSEKKEGEAAVPLWMRFQKNLNAPMGAKPDDKRQATRVDASPRTADAPMRSQPHPATPPAPAVPRVVADPGSRASAGSGSRVEEPVERSQRPLWQQYRSGEPKPDRTDVNIQEIELSILGKAGAQERDVFIGRLFGGEEAAYLGILLELSQAKSWSEASRVIADRVFKKYQINIYSESAVAFTNAVEASYRSRSVDA